MSVFEPHKGCICVNKITEKKNYENYYYSLK